MSSTETNPCAPPELPSSGAKPSFVHSFLISSGLIFLAFPNLLFLWGWHGRDIYTLEDEITDRARRIKAGDKKFMHAHIVVDIPCKVPVSTVARWFGVPANMVKICRDKGAFLDVAEYPAARESGSSEAGQNAL